MRITINSGGNRAWHGSSLDESRLVARGLDLERMKLVRVQVLSLTSFRNQVVRNQVVHV